MVTTWSMLVYILLPPAFVLLFLVTIPLPKSVSRWLAHFLDLLMSIRIGQISVFSIITFGSFLAAGGEFYELYRKQSIDKSKTQTELSGYADIHSKATRWRMERNFWISFFNFMIYWCLFRFHIIKKENLGLVPKEKEK